VRIHNLETVDGFIAFDLDDCAVSAGGTRFAPDVTEAEAALLARAMTYKFGAIGRDVGGAKGAVRGSAPEKDDVMKRYCEEIRPLVRAATFLTGPDLGTSESDFGPIRSPDAPPSVMAGTIGSDPIEDLVTGFGVVVAAEAAIGSLEGLTFAIEGFGKVGGGVAREVVRRGGKVVAVSTIDGCVHDSSGLDVELLLSLRRERGDRVVSAIGGEYNADPAALFDVDAEVLVPGARTGVITRAVAERLRMRWIVPAANVPYASDAIDVMRGRRVRYLADFVCNAGATIGYSSNAKDAGDLFRRVEDKIAALTSEAGAYPQGPFEGACAIAERFITSWRGADGLPPGPPLA
jgi:glutamate dehydrogenase/leucine dehydrogenase